VGKEYAKEIHEANVPLETWLIEHRLKVLKELAKKAPASSASGMMVTDE
jgi:D-alanyl-D-alanine carboxypeptidase